MSNTFVVAPPSNRRQTPAHMCQLLTREQYFALARLVDLLQHREAVDTGRLTADRRDQPWLIHALDAAIVSYYRLASDLGIETDARVLLRTYRNLSLGRHSPHCRLSLTTRRRSSREIRTGCSHCAPSDLR